MSSKKNPTFESQLECIVGIGASAGGLQALITFIKAIDPKAAIAYVIIQHLTPGHRSYASEIFQRYSALPIVEIKDGLEVQAGHIYTSPANKEVSLRNNCFVLDARNATQTVHLPIDHFFNSLALNSENRAVGIVLSGNGTDGALGLKCLVKNNGIAIVQEPGTAEFDGMPRSAISTGVATQVMKIEDMHTALAANLDHLLNFSIKRSQKQMINDSDVQEIIQIIKNKRVYDFSGYKRSTFIRRTMRRISLCSTASASAYIKLLKKDTAEVDRLFKDLLIGVTEFYRDAEAWETLGNDVIAPLISQKSKDEPIRIWVPGCSTGEEAYSMAMMVTDKVRRARKNCPVQIFATDTNKDALEIARLGTYPAGIVEKIPATQLKRYFTKNKNKENYTVNKVLRSTVVFGVQNLFADPPFGNVDLISCRNVLIYLDAKLQKKIINFFHFALSNNGALFLGSAESIGSNDKLFNAISNRWRIFKKAGNTKAELALVPKSARVSAKTPSDSFLNISESTQISSIAQKLLLDRFTPASVLVNDDYEALYFSGEVEEFLIRPRGTPTHALLTMVKEGLRLKLRNALEEAASTKLTVSVISARIGENRQILPVKITVTPYFGSELGRLFLVVFEFESKKVPGTKVNPTQNNLIRQLEEDLHATRDDLRGTVLQFEAATERLKASNEQVVTNNEELRSLNEELESSKEELQSLNEELSTSNQQLEVKIKELQGTNNDLHNLLNSNDIATICLDQSLKIKWFAPATQKQFNFIVSDIGRPIQDLISAIGDNNLVNAAHDVINQKRATDFEFQVGNGRWYVRRLLPYKLDEKRTKGVIVTYTDITDVHLANEAARDSIKDLHDSKEKQEQKKVLLTALAMAEERERKTLAKYLHDDLGQIFAVISLKANAVKRLASTEEVKSSLDDCMTAITHANEKLREMAFQLNPPMFEKIEFVTALRWMADEMHRIYNLNVEIDDDGYPKYLEHAMSATVFRATRELLTNVSKHAHVERARITLRRKNKNLLILTVSDAGAGFDQTTLPSDEHREKLGLISIRERMNILGASISIYTNPGDGTSVELNIPLIPAPLDSGMQNPGNAL